MDKQNYYEILNVEPNATKMAIREAYLRLKNTFGSGNAALYSLMSEDEAQANATAVEHAYKTLNDDTKRAEYDRSLGFDWEQRNARLSDIPGAERAGRLDEIGASGQMESRNDSHRNDAAHRFNQVITTTRSTLPVIKTKADNARTEPMQHRIASMIAEGDPGDGDLYKHLREAVGVSEAEMQERTKISLEYLRAMETNRFERLPQAVYVKGFLRSYFRYLAIPSAEQLVSAYGTRLEAWQTSRKN